MNDQPPIRTLRERLAFANAILGADTVDWYLKQSEEAQRTIVEAFNKMRSEGVEHRMEQRNLALHGVDLEGCQFLFRKPRAYNLTCSLRVGRVWIMESIIVTATGTVSKRLASALRKRDETDEYLDLTEIIRDRVQENFLAEGFFPVGIDFRVRTVGTGRRVTHLVQA